MHAVSFNVQMDADGARYELSLLAGALDQARESGDANLISTVEALYMGAAAVYDGFFLNVKPAAAPSEDLEDLIEEMKNGRIYTGFYAYFPGREYFVITSRKNKTASLCVKAAAAANIPAGARSIFSARLQPASIQIKQAGGRYYYNIFSDGFGGYGSNDITDGKTIVINLQ